MPVRADSVVVPSRDHRDRTGPTHARGTSTPEGVRAPRDPPAAFKQQRPVAGTSVGNVGRCSGRYSQGQAALVMVAEVPPIYQLRSIREALNHDSDHHSRRALSAAT